MAKLQTIQLFASTVEKSSRQGMGFSHKSCLDADNQAISDWYSGPWIETPLAPISTFTSDRLDLTDPFAAEIYETRGKLRCNLSNFRGATAQCYIKLAEPPGAPLYPTFLGNLPPVSTPFGTWGEWKGANVAATGGVWTSGYIPISDAVPPDMPENCNGTVIGWIIWESVDSRPFLLVSPAFTNQITGDCQCANVQISGADNLFVFRDAIDRNSSFPLTATVTPSGLSPTFQWSVENGSDKVKFNGSTIGSRVEIGPTDAAHASTALGDVTVKVTATFPGGQCMNTHQMTVRKPWEIFWDNSFPIINVTSNVSYYSYPVHYFIKDQFCLKMFDSLVMGLPATEAFPVPPSGCAGSTGNGSVFSDGTIRDTIAGSAPCFAIDVTYQQSISVDCATVINQINVNVNGNPEVTITKVGGNSCSSQ